jgi:nucleotide-binding universal stress UspA family protein
MAAAHWAVREARLRGVPLRLVGVWPGERDIAQGVEAAWHRWAERTLRTTAAELAAHHPELRVTVEEALGDPTTVLLTESEHAGMLVLGSGGVGQIGGFFTGSVSLELAARASRPVVLVRVDTEVISRGEVVVGLGLRRSAEGLLGFAFDAAERRRAALHAVHASRVPAILSSAPWVVDSALYEAREKSSRRLSETLAAWRKSFPGVRVCEELALETPSRRLVSAAADAALVVVGRRPHPGGQAARLGPVSQAVIHHAACPMAIVPG